MTPKEFERVLATHIELKRRFQASNFEPIKVTMKYNNDVLTIIPCPEYFSNNIVNFENIKFYLIEGSSSNRVYGGKCLAEIAKELVFYKNNFKFQPKTT